MPAKNGSRTAFDGDHTFFGEVVNIAETLHDICFKEKRGNKLALWFHNTNIESDNGVISRDLTQLPIV